MKLGILIFIATIFTMPCSSKAKDLGFRYRNGKCVHETDLSRTGLNPFHLGQCGDLRGITLAHFGLDDSDLSGSLFDGSDLQETTFRQANLTGVSFRGAILSGGDLRGAVVHGASFAEAVLLNSHWVDADIQNTDFSGAQMSGLKLTFMTFTGCKFSGANLMGAELDFVNFAASDLSQANLTGANLKGSHLTKVAAKSANFTQADLSEADLREANGPAASFYGANLRHAKFNDSIFPGAKFNRAMAGVTDFSRTDLTNADMRGTALKDAIATETLFTGAIFNHKTLLPFSATEAQDRGMIFSVGSVFILWDVMGDDIDKLKTFLESQGIEVQLSTKSAEIFDGKEDLSMSTAVLHLAGSSKVYSRDMPVTGQKVLTAFTREGGTYIGTAHIGYMTDRGGYLKSMGDLVLTGNTVFYSGLNELTTILEPSSHPLLNGLSSKINLSSKFASNSKMHSYSENPPVALMKDSRGTPMLSVRDFGLGKVVNFGWSASHDGSGNTYHILTQAPAQQLILNAIRW